MRQIGLYEVEGELGRGGMGRVYRVRHGPTGAARALKVIEGVADSEARARFGREAEALARTGGEGVVPIHEVGVAQGQLYFVMDLMPGGSLRDLLARRSRLPWDEAVAQLLPVIRALERCHAKGIVHRDVKPENILLDAQGAARLSDFGLARDRQGDSLTRTGATLGSPAYLPPEQLVGEKGDERTDVYSVAALLYELVSGQVPYPGASWVEILKAAEKGQRPPLAGLGAPAELDRILDRALAPRGGDRTPGAAILAGELEALRPRPGAGSARTARRPAHDPAPGKDNPERRGSLAVLCVGGAALVTSVVALGWVAAHRAFPTGESAPGTGTRSPSPPAHEIAPAGSARPIAAPTPRPGQLPGRGLEGAPAWFLSLRPDRRPAALPPGVSFGTTAGEYVNEADGSRLVYVCGRTLGAGDRRRNIDMGLTSRKTILDAAEVRPFLIGKEEVSTECFTHFVDRTHRAVVLAPSLVLSPSIFEHPWELTATDMQTEGGHSYLETQGPCVPAEPVSHVTFADARDYARWAGADLPDRDQWMVAALSTPDEKQLRDYPWGNERLGPGHELCNARDVALLAEMLPGGDWKGYNDHVAFRAPPGTFPRDRSPCGAVDMAGNVSEWVRVATPGSESQGVMGGSWAVPPDAIQLRDCLLLPASLSTSGLGFRIMRSLDR